MSGSSRFDVVIIGSGMASLTSAALLSKKGFSVCVLEQYSKVGGYLHCFSRFGHRFDTGAHYTGAMGPGQPFHTLLRYLEAYDESLFVPLDPEGFDVFRFPDFEFQLPKGYEKTIERLTKFFPSEREAIRTYFERVKAVVKLFPTYEFTDDALDPVQLIAATETSLATVVEKLTQSRSLRAILYSHCTLHGVMPQEISFGLHAIMVDSLIRGPYGFAKGGDALAQKMVAVIQKNGGTVLTKKKVTRIETMNKIAQAVHTDSGDRYEAKWIVSGCHPKATFRMVDDPGIFSPAFRQRLHTLKETIGIFGIYATHQAPPQFDRLKNYYYFESAEPEKMLDLNRKSDAKPGLAFICPSERIAKSTGTQTLPISIHAACSVEWYKPWIGTAWNKRPHEYHAAKNAYANQIFDFLDQFHPQLKTRIDHFETSTPLSNLYFNGSEEGSAYGIYHSIQNTGARALGPRTHIPNLLITGQNTLFPGILGAAVSALRSAGHICGIKPILKELKELAQ